MEFTNNKKSRGKISQDDVQSLLKLYVEGYSQNYVAFKFHIDRSTVRYYIDKFHIVRQKPRHRLEEPADIWVRDRRLIEAFIDKLQEAEQITDPEEQYEARIIKFEPRTQQIIRRLERPIELPSKNKPKRYLDFVKASYSRKGQEVPRWILRLHHSKKRRDEVSGM